MNPESMSKTEEKNKNSRHVEENGPKEQIKNKNKKNHSRELKDDTILRKKGEKEMITEFCVEKQLNKLPITEEENIIENKGKFHTDLHLLDEKFEQEMIHFEKEQEQRLKRFRERQLKRQKEEQREMQLLQKREREKEKMAQERNEKIVEEVEEKIALEVRKCLEQEQKIDQEQEKENVKQQKNEKLEQEREESLKGGRDERSVRLKRNQKQQLTKGENLIKKKNKNWRSF